MQRYICCANCGNKINEGYAFIFDREHNSAFCSVKCWTSRYGSFTVEVLDDDFADAFRTK